MIPRFVHQQKDEPTPQITRLIGTIEEEDSTEEILPLQEHHLHLLQSFHLFLLQAHVVNLPTPQALLA